MTETLAHIQAIRTNIREFYRRTYWGIPEAVVELGEGYTLYYSGKSWLVGANQLWLDDGQMLNTRILNQAADFFRAFFAEWSLLIIPQVQPNLLQACHYMGGFARWQSPILFLDEPPDLQIDTSAAHIEPVRGQRLREQASEILDEVFQMGVDLRRTMMPPEQDADSRIQHYIAYHEDHPAAAATVNYGGGIAGIWNVGTRRMFRRKGLAKALMARIIQDAGKLGYPASALIASSQGQPLYLSMGYRSVGELHYMGVSA